MKVRYPLENISKKKEKGERRRDKECRWKSEKIITYIFHLRIQTELSDI